MVQASVAVPQFEPGLVPLEQLPESDGKFGHIAIPRFPRRLLFSPVPAYGGRRVEWVPEWVAQYAKDRWKKHFVVATDLAQQKNTLALKDQVREALREIVQEPWFQTLLQGNGPGEAVQVPVPEPESAAGPSPVEEPAAPGARYVPRGRLVNRKSASAQE